jgi:hypothetical protein
VPPANVVPIELGKKMAEMLASGELAAAIGVEIDHPDVKPLIPNPLEAGLAALKSRGHYPINHTVVIKDDLIAAHPGLAADAFHAFAESKRLYMERLKAGRIEKPTEVDKVHARRSAALRYRAQPQDYRNPHRACPEAGHHHQAGDGGGAFRARNPGSHRLAALVPVCHDPGDDRGP